MVQNLVMISGNRSDLSAVNNKINFTLIKNEEWTLVPHFFDEAKL